MRAKKILIIEDDELLSKTLRNLLKANGYIPEIANSGSDGILRVYDFLPDLILCDINMKPINGYQVYRILNDSSVTQKIPFIFITARSEIKDIRMGMELGADDYIVKPFENEDLLKSIEVRLKKFETLVDIGKSDYRALLELSPNGIFLFSEDSIFEINQAFSQLTGYNIDDLEGKTLKQLIDSGKQKSLFDNVDNCSNGLLKTFDEEIEFIKKDGDRFSCRLYVTASQQYNGFVLLLGIISTSGIDLKINQSEYRKLINILSEEHVDVSGNLVKKLQNEFHLENNDTDEIQVSTDDLFSKREKEVLLLSCKGLPIKNIADELNISGRTVEKHRAKLMEKTGSRNIVEVIVYALKNDLIEL